MEPTLMSGIWGGPEQVCFHTPVLHQLSTAAYEELSARVLTHVSQGLLQLKQAFWFLALNWLLITCVLLDITCPPSDVYFVAPLNITAL
ncbi:hypothetical protein GOODEAATRI_032132 [Goodea atripinnis]|uniref:Uncharacterized protein n=1 Tax=Goodea atripinnis TaxID=208336 RepID=A0ABV0N971_9TELE